jgi:chromosome segregation ATPase
MSPQTYETALEEAKKELAQAIEDLGEAEQKVQDLGERISNLRQTVTVLSKLCGVENVEVEDALGLTEAIRRTFVDAPLKTFAVQDMRLALEARGFNTRKYGNLLASIHTVIGRLEAKQKIEKVGDNTAGKPIYQHKFSVPDSPPIPMPPNFTGMGEIPKRK